MADSRDILGKNRKFTGTSGIKLPEGTTAQRDTGQGSGAIRFNTETATAEYYDGVSWQAISAPPQISTVSPTNVISGDGSTQTFIISGSNFTTAGALTANLPASPQVGDQVRFLDLASTFDTNNLTIGRNGNNINGAAADLVVSTEDSAIGLVYTGATYGWKLIEVL